MKVFFSQESLCGEETPTPTFVCFVWGLLICSGPCASAFILILLTKIKHVQICLGGDCLVGKGKVNHTWHLYSPGAQDSPHTAAACQTPAWDAGLLAARLLSLGCGTHREEDKTEMEISGPAHWDANSEPFGTAPGFRHRPVVSD